MGDKTLSRFQNSKGRSLSPDLVFAKYPTSSTKRKGKRCSLDRSYAQVSGKEQALQCVKRASFSSAFLHHQLATPFALLYASNTVCNALRKQMHTLKGT